MTRRLLLLCLCITTLLMPESGRADEAEPIRDPSEPWQGMISQETPAASNRVWVRGEYLMWLAVSGKLLQLAKSNNFEVPAGVSEAVTTGGLQVENPLGADRQGYRLSAGVWLDDESIIGIDGSVLYLYRDAGRVTFRPGDSGIVADALGRKIGVPVLQGNPSLLAIVPVRASDLVRGGVGFEFGAKSLFGTEIAARFGLIKGETWRIDGLAGYQYLDYRDTLSAIAGVTTVAAKLNPGTTLLSRDDISARSTYNGLLLGFQADAHFDRWTLSARPRVSVAASERVVNRQGSTEITLPGGGKIFRNEGTYILRGDAGTYKVDEITAIPELDLGISYAVTPHLRLFAGTSAMFLPVVAKANNQLQLGVRPERLATGLGLSGALPPINAGEPPIRNNLLFMTLSLGLEWTF